jgi:hypothetical protein
VIAALLLYFADRVDQARPFVSDRLDPQGFVFFASLAARRVAFAFNVFEDVDLLVAILGFGGGQGDVGARNAGVARYAGSRPMRSVNQLHLLQPFDEQGLRIGAGKLERAADARRARLDALHSVAMPALSLQLGHRLVEKWRSSHNGKMISRYRSTVKRDAPGQNRCKATDVGRGETKTCC